MHNGVNYTVRLGANWYDKVKAGDKVFLLTTGTVPEVSDKPKGVIVDVTYIRYREIPAFVLENEHDPECTNFKGLNKAMEKAYPEFLKDPYYFNSYVTCLGFVIE